jgi:hypothetical protein
MHYRDYHIDFTNTNLTYKLDWSRILGARPSKHNIDWAYWIWTKWQIVKYLKETTLNV